MQRTCSKCQETKELNEKEFNLIRVNKNGTLLYNNQCRECRRKYSRERHRAKTLEERKAIYQRARANGTDETRKAIQLKRKYGLTLEEFNSMVELQSSECYICENPIEGDQIKVDHCHKTGKIRKLLCHHCNTALGHLKDDPNLMRKCAEYIEEHQ